MAEEKVINNQNFQTFRFSPPLIGSKLMYVITREHLDLLLCLKVIDLQFVHTFLRSNQLLSKVASDRHLFCFVYLVDSYVFKLMYVITREH